jgi:hypothetical protein
MYFLFLFLSVAINDFGSNTVQTNIFQQVETIKRDSLERQILFNGRVWKNQVGLMDGDPYFLSSDFLTGTVGFNSYNFEKVKIKYDILNDELLLKKDEGTIIQINKELLTSFNLFFNGTVFHFVKINNDTRGNLSGYCHLVYEGKIRIYVKYNMNIIPPAFTNGLPKFSQINKVYIAKGNIIQKVDSRKGLLDLFESKEDQLMLKKFIISNQIRISRDNPDSFRRVIEYYESNTK